jgi:hypothetical protein
VTVVALTARSHAVLAAGSVSESAVGPSVNATYAGVTALIVTSRTVGSTGAGPVESVPEQAERIVVAVARTATRRAEKEVMPKHQRHDLREAPERYGRLLP